MTTISIETLESRLGGTPPRMLRSMKAVWWATQALRREILGFRFNYPMETVPAAGPRESRHYYIYSHSLFFDAMVLNLQGVPLHQSRHFGETYNPAYIAWYGLVSLERFLRGLDSAGCDTFLKQVDWLVTGGVPGHGGSVIWPYTFDWQEGYCLLKAPWVCAMAQGLAMSALVRGYRITGNEHLLDICRAATRVFEKNVEDGGVRTLERGYVLYEEYPAYPLPRVLDGFLFSLLGLYDISVETCDPRISQLFADGIGGLKHRLEFWNYRNKWSWYGSHGYLCPPHYHNLNCLLLSVLGRLTGDETLKRYAELWNQKDLSVMDKLEIFLVFTITKNWARIRLPRN